MATIDEQIVKELHQMNIYLKSIAESLTNRKVILKAKPENRKKIEEQIANGSGSGVLFVDDQHINIVEIIKEDNVKFKEGRTMGLY